MAFKNLGKGLENMHTEFKSLKFGKDRPGGGSSNQPYIRTTIPVGEINPKHGKDFLLRGGSSAFKRVANDISRISQMLVDTKSPSGILFTAKQNLLSRIGTRTQASGGLNEGIYLPTSTIANLATSPLGYHLNKQGVDPTVTTGINNRIGSISSLFGVNAPLGLPQYNRILQNVVGGADGSQNRLIKYTTKFINSENNYGGGIIDSYPGGPNSILGIGKTVIHRHSNTTLYSYKNEFRKNYYFQTPEEIQSYNSDNLGKVGIVLRDSLRSIQSKQAKGTNKSIVSNSAFAFDINKRLEPRTNMGDPGRKGRNLTSYTKGSGLGALDKINTRSIYRSESVNVEGVNDLVKFRIAVIDNDEPTFKTFLHFRAYIDQFNESYNSEWSPIKYSGRGESLYRYNGFDRKVSLGWTVMAHSKEELIPMYKKLNYLASSLAPDYSENGYMRGNLVSLTLGGYFYEQVGIITNLTYSIDEETTWEIGIDDEGGSDKSVKELPHRITVTGFNFIPIHDFVPQKQTNKYNESVFKGEINAYGKERYIALANGSGDENNNYDS